MTPEVPARLAPFITDFGQQVADLGDNDLAQLRTFAVMCRDDQSLAPRLRRLFDALAAAAGAEERHRKQAEKDLRRDLDDDDTEPSP
jgi:hypothetical protein